MSVYTLKAFITIQSLINNTPGSVSNIGEISPFSGTFSREKGYYENSTYSGFGLTSFSSKDSVSGNTMLKTVTADLSLQISSYIFTYLRGKVLPLVGTSFYTAIMTQFAGSITNLTIGSIIDAGNVLLDRMPDWISYTATTGGDLVKLYYTDGYFSQNYDEFEIVVIPPITNLDDFFLASSIVTSKVNAVGISTLFDYVQAAKASRPETYIRISTFNYINPLNSSNTVPTSWPVLIYGAAGDNADSIGEAVTQYILANSTHTQTQWTTIMPSLFKRTEFVILPRWDKYAIPNLTVQSGIYSCNVSPNEVITFAKGQITFYDSTIMDTKTEVLAYSYKNIVLVCVGSGNNDAGKTKISELFPDYINVATTSTDYGRMSVNTQGWDLTLQQLLITAETATINSVIPAIMRKVIRNNKLYITTYYNTILYVVAAKINYGA